MQVFFADRFRKRFQKLPSKIKTQFEKRLDLFRKNPFHPQLKNHPLKGYLAGFRAFSVTGDYRVIYQIIDHDNLKLIDIGTHSPVYE